MDDAELARERESDRRPLGLQQQLFELAPDALGRQIVERDRRSRCARFRDRSSARTAPQTAARGGHGASHRRTSRGSTTRRTRSCEIVPAMKRIEIFIGQRIPADRVDREITPPRRLFERHRRIAFDGEALVAAAGLRFAARQRHVDRAEFVDRKGLADRLDAAERLQQRAAARSCGMPKTSMSRSFEGRSSSRSRTNPPTHSARPPASRTAVAMRRACCSRSTWTAYDDLRHGSGATDSSRI